MPLDHEKPIDDQSLHGDGSPKKRARRAVTFTDTVTDNGTDHDVTDSQSASREKRSPRNEKYQQAFIERQKAMLETFQPTQTTEADIHQGDDAVSSQNKTGPRFFDRLDMSDSVNKTTAALFATVGITLALPIPVYAKAAVLSLSGLALYVSTQQAGTLQDLANRMVNQPISNSSR